MAPAAAAASPSVDDGKGVTKKGKKAAPPPPIPAAAIEALLCLRAIVAEVCSPAGPFEVIDGDLEPKTSEVIRRFVVSSQVQCSVL